MRAEFDTDNAAGTATVEVNVTDVFGQNALAFDGLRAETPIADVLGESRTQMALAPDVPWQVQDARTARLLRQDQTVGEIAREGKVDLKMVPDARLG